MTDQFTDRRTVIRTLGAGLAGAALVPGTASAGSETDAQPEWFPPLDGRTRWGEPAVFGTRATGIVQPFLRVTEGGDPEYVGVYLTDWTLDQLPTRRHHYARALDLPDGSPFTHVGFDWNPEGHEPPGIYTEPHFDFHFHLLGAATVGGIGAGAATYSIPDAQMPEGYVRTPQVDTDGDGQADAPPVVPGMGEHLVDPESPEFHGERFTHTHIYGAYDPDDDGTGRLTFMEPMVTTAFMRSLDGGAVRADVGTPESFAEPGQYPTEYAVRHLPDQDGYAVTLAGFEAFP